MALLASGIAYCPSVCSPGQPFQVIARTVRGTDSNKSDRI